MFSFYVEIVFTLVKLQFLIKLKENASDYSGITLCSTTGFSISPLLCISCSSVSFFNSDPLACASVRFITA
eukprot:m.308207 g.308207  ORF g.308207 m.308207 type:complete len:71 (-) comp16472_c0_seq33:972-1184(-)